MRECRFNEESEIAYDCHASIATCQRNFHRYVILQFTSLIKLVTLFLSSNHVLPTFLRIYLPTLPDVDTDPRAAYFRQMEYGMYMRMAILSSMLLKRDV